MATIKGIKEELDSRGIKYASKDSKPRLGTLLYTSKQNEFLVRRNSGKNELPKLSPKELELLTLGKKNIDEFLGGDRAKGHQ